jgi:hypothetical protein
VANRYLADSGRLTSAFGVWRFVLVGTAER